MTAELIPLAPGLSVAGQLDRADIDALARKGVRTIINNRPDDEDAGQLPAAKAQKLAEAQGIAYHHIPITAASLSRADVDAFAAALDASPLPVVAHCRRRDPLDLVVGAHTTARRRRAAGVNRRGGAPRDRHRGVARGCGKASLTFGRAVSATVCRRARKCATRPQSRE